MQKIKFNDNWSFYANNGEKKNVCLPHDAMLEGGRSPKAEGGSAVGFFLGGNYVYEKTFDRPKEAHVIFEFEGVYKNTKVLINGHPAGENAYGYTGFFVEADKYLSDGENVLRVECENMEQPDSRWYSGAGIYRPVWMHVGEEAYIAPEGVKIDTVSIHPPKVQVKTEHVGGEVKVEIYDGAELLGVAKGEDVIIELSNAELWCEKNPKLYTCKVTLLENGEEKDVVTEKFGIRKIEWSPKGLFINGEETLLRGCCIHHDNGVLGAATNDESEWRRAKLLKDAGYNAIRSSHNPTSRAMLEACDALGIYMMDETWDIWYSHKSKYDYASNFMDNYKKDIESMVNRDYNHPSVIFYSIGNEVSEPAKKKGVDLAREMVAYIKALDSSRAVTAGMNLMIIAQSAEGKGVYKEDGGRDNSSEEKMSKMNSTMFNMITSMVGSSMNKAANSKKADEATTPVLDALDIAGYNYASGRYPLEGNAHPNRIIFGSETFPPDIYKNWEMVKKYPYLIGDFMWTAWDYIGEAGIGAWAYTPDGKGFEKPYPWLLADVGTMDILGNPNGELFWAQAVWGLLDKPMIAVRPVNHPGVNPAKGTWRGTNAIPSWSWNGCEGNKAVVEIYSDAAFVELYLNGKKLGKKKPKECRAIFKTKYMAGTLEAVAYNGSGAEIGRNTLYSAEAQTNVRLIPEQKTASAGEIIYVKVNVTDRNGTVERNNDKTVTVTVEGGELLGFGSANPRTEENYQSGTFTTYYGEALAAIRVGKAGTVKIVAKSEGYQTEATINVTE